MIQLNNNIELNFSRSDEVFVLTKVNGTIKDAKISDGKNYLNFIPINSFAGTGTYPISYKITGTENYKHEPTMIVSENNEWKYFAGSNEEKTGDPQVISRFTYYSSMFTLTSKDPNVKEGERPLIFLGTGQTGLLAYMVNKTPENYLLASDGIKAKLNYKSTKLPSQEAGALLAPYTGYYTFADKQNCFFSVYRSIVYSKWPWSEQRYEVTLTYCLDNTT